MTISSAFSPGSALLGGILIGIAAVLLLMSAGRIAGVSGYVSRLLPPYENDAIGERVAFVLGLLTAPVVVMALTGGDIVHTVTNNSGWLISGGLLVGLGTVLGGGCTSGHGVCGLARLSLRSLVATAVFMAAALATVYFVRHMA